MIAPLVSCVMVTCGRPAFVAQSVRYFLAQDYAERELVIVYEDEADLPAPFPDVAAGAPAIRTRRVTPGMSLGAKRNLGVTEASGDVIAQWDDDDWYAPARLRRQLEPILRGAADITALRAYRFFELEAWTLWSCSPALHARMFVHDVAGGTLVYRREVWGRDVRYPASNLREDADFLCAALAQGARLTALPDDDLFVYVRHGRNTWSFTSGVFLDAASWRRLGPPPWPDELLAFYRDQARRSLATEPGTPRAKALRLERGAAAGSPATSLAASSAPRTARPGRAAPRVACIMPTGDRPELVARALRHFLRQRYPQRELIVVDDGQRPIRELLPIDERIRYLRLDRKLSLGAKRNLACEATSAEVIVHWDDDDWMAPSWIEAQVAALAASDADVTGLAKVHFYAPTSRLAWRYVYPAGARPWVHGATFCYARGFWQRNPFADVTVGEDLRFLWQGGAPRVVPHDGSELFVAYLHGANTSPKHVHKRCWHACPVEYVEALMLRDAGEPP